MTLRGAIAVLTLGVVAIWPAAAPADAHVGGKAVVLVRDLSLAPAGGKWMLTAVLVDSDQGSAIRAEVKAVTGSPAKTYDLDEVSVGTYTGRVDGLASGPAQMTIKARTQPGFESVVPFTETYPFQLVAGQSVQIHSAGAGHGSGLPLILGVSGAVLAVALLYGLYSLRRRTAAPRQPN